MARPCTCPSIVKNVLAWCNVTVNGGAPSSAGVITTHVTPGDIPISAVAVAGFKITPNMWHHTKNDVGGGETGTITQAGGSPDPTVDRSSVEAVVAVGASKCVWICCPFPDGSGCNVGEQCP